MPMSAPDWTAQMQSWHDGGMFVGMHWLWWLFWVFTLLVIGWSFVRLGTERSDERKELHLEEAAEEALRRRFADGEIDEEEYRRRMSVLRETGQGH